MKTSNPYDFCLFKIPTGGGRLIWEITNSCNYSCRYCIFSSGNTDTSKELTTEEVISALDEIWEYGIRELKITGGEPFMRKDMCEILGHASEIGFKIDISTNASFLTDKHCETLKDPAIRYVHVSLDGSDRIMQELVRGKHSYDLTLRGINKLVKAGIYTRIGTVIHAGNQDHLKDMIEHVKAIGVQEIIFSIMESVGRMRGDDSGVTTRDIPSLEKELTLLKFKYKDSIKVNFAFTRKKEEKCGNATCPGGKKFIFLNNLGQLSPCTWISEYFPEFVSKATLKTKSFTELAGGEEMKEYFKLLDDLSRGGMAGCPKSYLKEIRQQKESDKLFLGSFDDNMRNGQRFTRYSPIYSFATENLNGYYPRFDWNGAKVLTVTASGDHAINAILSGSRDVTCFDSNSLSGLWAELKIKAMRKLDYNAFLDFFMRDGNRPLAFDIYCNFRDDLSMAARRFFDNAYDAFGNDGNALRESSLFNNKHDTRENKISYNPYLLSENDYDLAKRRLATAEIRYLDISIQELCGDKDVLEDEQFDIIALSNIADYSHEMYSGDDYLERFKNEITDKLQDHLSPKGKLLLAYIYDSGNGYARNDIDSQKSRKEVFGGAGYDELSFPSAMGAEKNDTIAFQEKRVFGSLIENSESYYEKARIYDRFSEAEDSLGKVLDFLKAATRDKTVLDVGCGTGKYLKLLAPTIRSGIGLDVSDRQIAIARDKCSQEDNLSFMISTAETIDIPDDSVDVIYGTWCIGSIPEASRRESIIRELKRILKRGGRIYLIENDETGEFEEIRGKTINPAKPTMMLNKHIRKMGFTRHMDISTSFRFDDIAEAKNVFGTIWGERVADRIGSEEISHEVVIFSRCENFI